MLVALLLIHIAHPTVNKVMRSSIIKFTAKLDLNAIAEAILLKLNLKEDQHTTVLSVNTD